LELQLEEGKMIKRILIIILVSGTLVFLNFCGNQHQKEDFPGRGKLKNQRKFSRKGAGNQQRRRGRKGNNQYTLDDNRNIYLSDDVKKQIEIKTVAVRQGYVKSTLKAMGKVLAPNDRKAIVGFAFSARIIKLHTAVGEWVEKGDALVTLECEEVGNAQSDYVKALTDYELSKLDFDREERLFKQDIGAKKEYLEAKAKFQIAQAGLRAAEKKLMVLGFSKEQMKEISKTKSVNPLITVKASISGRIVKNNAILGAMIDASTEIMVIIDLGSLWIDAEIYEKDLSKIVKGQLVEVSVPAYPNKPFNGTIHYIGDVVDPETRTINVRTKVINKEFKLKPGMFADILIKIGDNQNAMVIPSVAVMDDGNEKIVFVLEGDRFIRRLIQVGAKYNGEYEILKGLKLGDKVVVEGNYQLKSMLQEGTLSHSH
jgi:cobalt-zinc-cadmium efflux system membrane fusion protein